MVEGREIAVLILVVGQKCNLKCKNCSNFTPLLPQVFYNFDTIVDDLQKISSIAKINLLQIQGGEVFAWDKLVSLLIVLRQLDFVRTIQLATNGTYPLNLELKEFILKDKDTRIRISHYPNVNTKLSNRLSETCDKYGVPYFKHTFSNGNDTWSDLGDLDYAETSDIKGEETFNSCNFRGCLTLEDGVLGRCSRGTTAHKVQFFTPKAKDLFDIRSEFKTTRDFSRAYLEYIFNPKPMRACNFCKSTKGDNIMAGQQYTRKEYLDAVKKSGLLKKNLLNI